MLYIFSSRSKSKGKLVSNGHNSPSNSSKNDVTIIEEKSNSRNS